MTANRNDPCPCGSGKKYKKCCLAKDAEAAPTFVEPERGTPNMSVSDLGGPPLDFGDEPLDRMGIHPYAICKFVEQEKETGEIKRAPGFATPSEVAAMPLDAIEARVRSIGVELSREKFLELAATRLSAWTISDDWLEKLGAWPSEQDIEFLGLAACELWKRWSPERPSLEMLDDWLEEGYRLRDAEEPGVCDVWWKAWAVMRPRFAPEMRTVEAATSVYDCQYNLGDWLEDLSQALLDEVSGTPARGEQGLTLVRAVLAQFPDEEEPWLADLEADLAAFLSATGEEAAGLERLEQLIRDRPHLAVGYVRLAEEVIEHDPKRAVELLTQAKGKEGAEGYGINQRLRAAKAARKGQA